MKKLFIFIIGLLMSSLIFAQDDPIDLSHNKGVITEDVTYDGGTGTNLVTVLNPDYAHYTDPETLVTTSDLGSVDDTWKDQGVEIDCRTYKNIGIWVDQIVNDATGNQLQVLSKHTSSGADEYVLATAGTYQKTMGDNDIKILYPFNVETVPYIQIQTKATDIGITAAYLTSSINHQPAWAVWEAITDGSIRITLNGTSYNVDGIDYTGISDLDGVATVTQAAIRVVTGSDETVVHSTFFIFTANDDSNSSITALETSTGTVGTDVSGYPKASNIWFDAYDTDGIVTAATGTVGTVSIEITKEY